MIKVIINYQKSAGYLTPSSSGITDQRECDTLLECFQYMQDQYVWYNRSGFEFFLLNECQDGTWITWDLEFPDFRQKKIEQLGNAYNCWKTWKTQNFERKHGKNW